jgi:hypothetical protein
MNVCLSTGRPEILSFKNGFARRIATQGFNLECVLDTPVGSFEALKNLAGTGQLTITTSARQYTPL